MSPFPQLTTVPQVELDRYIATWFEVCRLPLKWEDPTAQDVSATYSKSEDGKIVVDNRCLDKKATPIRR